MTIEIVRSIAELRQKVGGWRSEGLSVGLVPTMGGIHEGHLSLVRQSLERTQRTVATIFVNPLQFGEEEDFDAYPRDEEGDARQLDEAGAHLLYAPSIDEVYPEGGATSVTVHGISESLEGKHRPGFFTGVATVVSKLLMQSLPDTAFFGEKDYQQLQVIKHLVNDLDIPVAIEAGDTVRESDGLAISSRNVYLNAEERAAAPALYETICNVAGNVSEGGEVAEQTALGMEKLVNAGFTGVDYLEVCDAETLEPWPGPKRPGRVLAAAHLGKARLIDNVPL